ncbi:hypothetical protein IE4803_PB00463 (plasmid) [Rhizobium etli bv. phaseoli str. IE4803]|nr:hypothetical protein IE4803_PB00463 [Rhizobium etli bv. phaseoli str. IE4803]
MPCGPIEPKERSFWLGFRKLVRTTTGNLPTNPNVADRTKPTDGVVMASLAPLGRPRARATPTISRTMSFENKRQSHIPVAKREMAYRTGDAASAQVIELRLVAEQANFDRAGPPRPTAGQKQRQELRLGPRT